MCKKHELSGIILTCEHLLKMVWAYKPTSNFMSTAPDDLDDGDEYIPSWKYMLCDSCYKEYKNINLYKFKKSKLLKPSCAKCFKELTNSIN